MSKINIVLLCIDFVLIFMILTGNTHEPYDNFAFIVIVNQKLKLEPGEYSVFKRVSELEKSEDYLKYSGGITTNELNEKRNRESFVEVKEIKVTETKIYKFINKEVFLIKKPKYPYQHYEFFIAALIQFYAFGRMMYFIGIILEFSINKLEKSSNLETENKIKKLFNRVFNKD
ncbi:MAG: hypothetical protein SFU98_16735 [Leptospiraceae bacterium]|nr:hypothetical protein [Leptospiraceae bacterium]